MLLKTKSIANLRVKINVYGVSLRLEDALDKVYDALRVKRSDALLEGAFAQHFQIKQVVDKTLHHVQLTID